jgi:hypothetical protein
MSIVNKVCKYGHKKDSSKYSPIELTLFDFRKDSHFQVKLDRMRLLFLVLMKECFVGTLFLQG